MINIGDTLVLELKQDSKFERYKCRLVEKNGEFLYIDYPINIDTSKTAFLLDGTQLKVTFASGESAYLFESEIIGRVKKEIPMMKISFPGNQNVIKIQRRQFVRVETGVDVAIHSLDSTFKPFTAITRDISAGGSLIVTDKPIDFNDGTVISCWFVLPMQNGEYHYINLMSKVIRMIENKDTHKTFSLEFIDVKPLERQILLRFSFDRQLKMKKRTSSI
jgi:c-di-GMP-binding flagellar brake protein YcgR